MKDFTPPSRCALYLVEWATLVGGVLCLVLYLLLGVSDRGFLVFYVNILKTAAYLYPFGLLLCYLVVTVQLGIEWRSQGSKGPAPKVWRAFREEYLSPKIIWRDLRHLHALSVTLVVAIHLKHLIPFVNSAVYDQAFLRGENALLSGRVAFDLLIKAFPLDFARLLSAGYQGYYPYLSILIFVMVLQRNSRLMREFCLAFILLWYLGMLVVYAVPTWGPCFYAPQLYRALPETTMTIMQQDLWSMRLSLLENSGNSSALYSISGFPSLHLAVALLGSWYLYHVNRFLGLASCLFSLLTLVTTLYFGWHYIADDIGSVALVTFSVYLSRQLEKWFEIK